MKKMVTIFTPTYNRAYILPNLYKSLLLQKNKNFLWLIVDDGSTDDTYELVKEWINQGFIEIKYYKQKNSGKHIAHNLAVNMCSTKLFFCVDSDDYLLDNAIEDILLDYEYIKDRDDISGIVTAKINNIGNPIAGTYMPKCIKLSGLCELSEKYGYKGDSASVFKSEILKQYKFLKIDNEKFMAEQYIFCQIDSNYKMYISQKLYYVCEYLEDGYTKNIFKVMLKNPKGYREVKRMKLIHSKKSGFKVRYKQASLYTVGCWISNTKKIIYTSPDKFYTVISLPLAIIVYYIRFYKLLKEKN